MSTLDEGANVSFATGLNAYYVHPARLLALLPEPERGAVLSQARRTGDAFLDPIRSRLAYESATLRYLRGNSTPSLAAAMVAGAAEAGLIITCQATFYWKAEGGGLFDGTTVFHTATTEGLALRVYGRLSLEFVTSTSASTEHLSRRTRAFILGRLLQLQDGECEVEPIVIGGLVFAPV